jgi:hypothetical protein
MVVSKQMPKTEEIIHPRNSNPPTSDPLNNSTPQLFPVRTSHTTQRRVTEKHGKEQTNDGSRHVRARRCGRATAHVSDRYEVDRDSAHTSRAPRREKPQRFQHLCGVAEP